MAGESVSRRAQVRRVRAANVAGGRPHTVKVKLSDAERTALAERAAAADVTIQRLLVETTLGGGSAEPGRAAAALRLLDFESQIARVGANVNQLTRYSHQDRRMAEHLDVALHAFVRACLAVENTARWVQGLPPAVTGVTLDGMDLAVDVPEDIDAGGADSWAALVDPE